MLNLKKESFLKRFFKIEQPYLFRSVKQRGWGCGRRRFKPGSRTEKRHRMGGKHHRRVPWVKFLKFVKFSSGSKTLTGISIYIFASPHIKSKYD